LLLIDADPRTRVAVRSRICGVLQGGVPLDREAINGAH
jgi:hypothetical protein